MAAPIGRHLGLANDVVVLDQRRRRGVVAAHLVAHADEHQLAGAAVLRRHVLDRRGACDPRRRPGSARGTRTGCRPTCAAATGPAAGSRRAPRWPSAPISGLAVQRQEVQPVPERRQHAARSYRQRRMVEGRVQRRDRRRPDVVVQRLAAADPGAQVGLRAFHRRLHRRPAVHRRAASSRVSCAAGTALQPLTFWPAQSGEKSPLPRASAFARSGAIAAVASGNAGAAVLARARASGG